MFEDLLRRTLKFLGFEVKQVMNITDVDDKTIRDANARGVPLQEHTAPITADFFRDLDLLKIERAEVYPAATEHVSEMIDLIQILINKEFAYKADNSVYFRISSFPQYGQLSGMKLDGLAKGVRIDSDEYESEIIDEGNLLFPDEDIKLEFDALDFGYSEELVLKNINFNVEPGKKLGLVGRTGSGKTTIARLIFRLYDPNNGKIKINGLNSKKFPLRELRHNIAYVTQEFELFKASIKDNITFFDYDMTDEQVLQVINDLGLKKWYDQLPKGLESIVFSEDLGLSAGEEQLLALTRAFLKNPKLVILDEASSRLDPATERQVDTALEKLLEGRSAIIIAHRLATLQKVDDILILEKGEIVEYGSREELVKDPNSHFSKLLQQGIQEVLT